MTDSATEDLLQTLAPQVLGAVVRRYGNFDLAEDAVQEALLAAALQWPGSGMPDSPKSWLITVAARRLTDMLRSEQARRQREGTVTGWELTTTGPQPPGARSDSDDTLILLFMSCHPSLSMTSQIALTLRAVGGLGTAEIGRALMVPESTVTRRITRAKRSILESGIPFALPSTAEQASRVDAVLRVLYLIFNEGYASTRGASLQRTELAVEAIRLARLLHGALPDNSEVSGLLALMLLTDARRSARTGRDGSLIPMADQDRTLWDPDRVAEGIALITHALPRGSTGPYQLQAAIAAVHDEAASWTQTDWPQIVALYEVLFRVDPNPIVLLNQAVAVAMVDGPQAGLDLLSVLATDPKLGDDRRFHAARAHLLAMAGDVDGAHDAFADAALRSTNLQHQRYIQSQIRRLRGERHSD